mgnify:CR=1 FL=1
MRGEILSYDAATGGLISGEQARQPDFLRPYLQAALATVGLRDLRFFTVEGTARGEEALAGARALGHAEVRAFFMPAADERG